MKERLREFAAAYAAEAGQAGDGREEEHGIRHPLLFLFVGDRSAGTLRHLMEVNRRRWSNHAGIMYLHAGSGGVPAGRGEPVPGSGPEADSLFAWQPPAGSGNKRRQRRELREAFYSEEAKLLELNVLVRRIQSRISAAGRLFPSLERVNIAVVTRADDPLSILVPELTVLLKSVFEEGFRSVQTDIYALTEEQSAGEEYAYDAALGTAFLRELDACQSRTYRLEAPLQLTSDGLKLPVRHEGPLFDTAYILGDKDERGLFPGGSVQPGDPGAGRPAALLAEIISQVNLLKYRRTSGDPDPRHNAYLHGAFKQNLMPPGGSGGYYATAGFARVTRPNAAIALAVLHAVYERLLLRMEAAAEFPQAGLLEQLGLDPAGAEAEADRLLAGRPDPVEDLHGLMSAQVAPADLKRMTLREAEEALYGGHARAFFEAGAAARAKADLAAAGHARRLEEKIAARWLGDPRFGCIAAAEWTAPQGRGSLTALVRGWRLEAERSQADAEAELGRLYEERAGDVAAAKGSWLGSLFGGGKSSAKALAVELLGRVYGLKLEILRRELTVELLRQYERVLERTHERMQAEAVRLHRLGSELAEASRRSISEAGDDLGRNIAEYYGGVVRSIEAELDSRRGPMFYWDEGSVGNVTLLLGQSEEALLERVMTCVRRDFFPNERFHLSFEGELLERANVAVAYENRNVLTKEELYRDLCRTLENEAAVRADVYRFTHTHRYEEKYYWGDFDSELIRYALALEDSAVRSYKLGCVHESRSSSVGKINLMGGFRLTDLMYYRSARRYYDTYAANGYEFHAMELPEPRETSRVEGGGEG